MASDFAQPQPRSPRAESRGAAFDVIALGEALVDFLPRQTGAKVRDVDTWIKCLGGAPANVLVGVSRLGGKSAMCGVTGEDEFGHFIAEELGREGVDVTHLRFTTEGKTGIGFVSLTATGERSFLFYRHQAAEFQLCLADIDHAFLASGKVLHLGTNSLLLPTAREASLAASGAGKARGQIVSCDPNLRLHLWKEPAQLRALLDQLFPNCAIVKLSDEEAEFVTSEKEPARALRALRAMGVVLPVVTQGPAGATALVQQTIVTVPAPKVTVVDTTGAGDGFMAGLLSELTKVAGTRDELARVTPEQLEPIARFACQVGSRVVTKLGAIAGLPRRDEL
jgi:fructokinase